MSFWGSTPILSLFQCYYESSKRDQTFCSYFLSLFLILIKTVSDFRLYFVRSLNDIYSMQFSEHFILFSFESCKKFRVKYRNKERRRTKKEDDGRRRGNVAYFGVENERGKGRRGRGRVRKLKKMNLAFLFAVEEHVNVINLLTWVPFTFFFPFFFIFFLLFFGFSQEDAIFFSVGVDVLGYF